MLTRHEITTLLLQPVAGVAPEFVLQMMREDLGHVAPVDLAALFNLSGGSVCEYAGGGLYRVK
jgi:hypothetical protein